MCPIAYIPRTRELYADEAPYRWVVNEDVPWTPLTKPLSRCSVALLSSGGAHHKDQPSFHTKDDTSYREIPKDAAVGELRIPTSATAPRMRRKTPTVSFP